MDENNGFLMHMLDNSMGWRYKYPLALDRLILNLNPL